MPSEPVAAVARALVVLNTFGSNQHTATLAQLAERTGHHKTTLLRMLATLSAHGFIRRIDGGSYRLGPELLRLGSVYQDSFNLVDHVRPILSTLVAETGESAAFYIPEDDARVCLCRAESPRSIRHHVSEGQRLPLDRGAAGRVLQAFMNREGQFLEQIRCLKVIRLVGDRVPDVSAICAPVFGTTDQLIGALQVSGPTTRLDDAASPKIKALVLSQAVTLTRELGGKTARLEPQAGGAGRA